VSNEPPLRITKQRQNRHGIESEDQHLLKTYPRQKCLVLVEEAGGVGCFVFLFFCFVVLANEGRGTASIDKIEEGRCSFAKEFE
jgi:hypothetical protein